MVGAVVTVVVAVTPNTGSRRLDLALVEALAAAGHEVTRSQLGRAFEAGGVRSDAGPLKPSLTVDRRLEVSVELPAPPLLSVEPEALPLDVLHEDAHILVVNKPPGMVVHSGPGHARGTLVGAVLHHLGVEAGALPVLPGNDETRPGIVHRLDKDTSGVIVVAKTAAAQARLAEQFADHSIERRYVGVVLGQPEWTERAVETLHGRDPGDRRRFSPTVPRGRRAASRFVVAERWRWASVVHCELETGRTHQIRMHARYLGHPIFGDALYGKRPRDAAVGKAWDDLGRHALHAERLGFVHPHTGRTVGFEAPWGADLAGLAEVL